MTLEDAKGKALSGIPVSLACSEHAVVRPEASQTDASGVERFDVTDGVPGQVTCIANADAPPDPNVPGILSRSRLDQTVTIRFTALTGRTADPLDTHTSVVSAAPATLRADLTGKSVVTVTLKDTAGHPLSGVPVSLVCFAEVKSDESAAANAVVTPDGGLTSQDGSARFDVTDGVPGRLTCNAGADTPVDPNVPGILAHHRLDRSAAVEFTPLSGRTSDPVDTRNSTAIVAPDTVVADLSSKAFVTLALKDGKGHRLAGVATALACLQHATAAGGGGSNHAVVTALGSRTSHDGLARFDVVDGVPGSVTCVASAETPTDPNVPGILDRHPLDQVVTIRFTPLSGRVADPVDTRVSTVTVEGAGGTTSSTLPEGGSTWDATAEAYRGKNGQRYSYVCPPDGTRTEVFGSNPYSDQSSVCTAAVNFGLITVAQGGTVSIEIAAGRKSFTGSDRNGTSTKDTGSWPGSFTFAGTPKITNEAAYGGVGWYNDPAAYRGQNGKQVLFSCPTGGKLQVIFGTDVYMDSDTVCTAAVQVGLITLAAGGDVIVVIAPGEDSYKGATRNGVTSKPWTRWAGSFTFAKN